MASIGAYRKCREEEEKKGTEGGEGRKGGKIIPSPSYSPTSLQKEIDMAATQTFSKAVLRKFIIPESATQELLLGHTWYHGPGISLPPHLKVYIHFLCQNALSPRDWKGRN